MIFGEEGDAQLLGAFTLEALGLSLDLLRRDLKPLPTMLDKSGLLRDVASAINSLHDIDPV